jgi:AraC-like DNA-binding protein
MERSTLARFLEKPAGRYLTGDTWCYFCPRDGLFGFALWGRPAESDLRKLVTALEVELDDAVPAHASLVDVRRVEAVDPAAFELLHRYVKQHAAVLARKVTRLALVRPAGLVGAVVSGFYQVMESPYPTQTFTELSDAAAWAGASAPLGKELEALLAEASGVDALLASLRALFSEAQARLDIAGAAKALGLSQRTLQRRLGALNTSFVAEVQHARMALAKDRLTASEAPLTAIAIDAGFSSLQHFSTAFRKATGASPSAWRERARRGR